MSVRDPSGNYLALIKVVGVGGGGSNAVNRMVDAGLGGCEFIAVNTDAQALLMVDADVKMPIGSDVTRGLGAGADPSVGKAAADESRDALQQSHAQSVALRDQIAAETRAEVAETAEFDLVLAHLAVPETV